MYAKYNGLIVYQISKKSIINLLEMSKKYKTNGWICPNNYEFIRQIRDSSKMNVYRRTWFNPQ